MTTYSVESVVNDVFKIFAHPNLFHQFVLVAVHAGQLTHVGKDVLEAVGELEGVHIVQTILK